jgi:hypothetical protein
MSYTPVTTGLYTTVENTSGAAAVFGFLGTHGRRLAANATYTVPGDLVSALGGGALTAKKSSRQFKALEKALKNGDLKIVSSPAAYLYDANAEETREVVLVDGVLGTVDPQWDPAGTGTSDFVDNDGPPVT